MRRKSFDSATGWARPATPPPGAELQAEQPARAADLVADLVVPLGQAVATGALVTGALALAAEALNFPAQIHVKGWLALGLVIAAIAWLVFLGQHRRLLWATERLTGLDLDGDGAAGDPGERVVIVNAAQAKEKATQQAEAQQATKRRSAFASFVAGLPVRGTSLRAWERAGLSREQYAEWRDLLIRLGWARWRSVGKDGKPNEKQGWELVLEPGEILAKVSG